SLLFLGWRRGVEETAALPPRAGVLPVRHRPCRAPARAGAFDADNSEYVIGCINAAVDGCRDRSFDAMATAPVSKAMINRAGIAFVGHTEWIAARCSRSTTKPTTPVMMLANDAMRMCLLTNHIPLAEVPRHVTAARLTAVINTVLDDLRGRFGIARPTIGVCGLNPHAGEGGYIGTEEDEVIAPTLKKLRADELRAEQQRDDGARIVGPISADTAFTRERLASFDAVLAMYHDQGLPVIKHAGFGTTVNITLGLPIVRTSVDHGTAIEIADAFTADESSLKAAIEMAMALCRSQGAVESTRR
ncbi:MAG: 4-hydroxythreonine-4-phosphate dehydrogenase PdxA, partial [bacterium]